jgi:hypothetical protein
MNNGVRRGTPLSSDQRRLWFIYELQPKGLEYNVDAVYRLRGPLQADALEGAVRHVVARHGALRTRVSVVDGEPYQVMDAAPKPELARYDLSAGPNPMASAIERARTESSRSFDLTEGPPIRVWLARLGDDDHVFGMAVHHIVFDRESMDVWEREVAMAYAALSAGREPLLPGLPAQYVDFAAWQRERSSAPERARDRDYWREKLQNVPVMLELPTDRPRPARPSRVAGEVTMRPPEEVARALSEVAATHRTTPFVAALAAFQALMLRYSGARAVAVGCPFNARTRLEFEGLIGFFARSLPIVVDLTDDPDPTLDALVTMTRDAVLEAHAHQEMPFEEIVRMADPPRDLSANPIFQVWFDLATVATDEGEGSFDLPGLTVTPVGTGRARTRFDLEMHLMSPGRGGGISGRLLYAVDLFDHATAEQMVHHYERILSAVALAPWTRLSQVSFLASEEREMIINEWGVVHGGPAR